eukprot:1079532-Pelagomonas_calceolata.AAC.1
MGASMLRYVPLTESNRAVIHLRYSLQSTSMASVMFLKVLKVLVQEHPISKFLITGNHSNNIIFFDKKLNLHSAAEEALRP